MRNALVAAVLVLIGCGSPRHTHPPAQPAPTTHGRGPARIALATPGGTTDACAAQNGERPASCPTSPPDVSHSLPAPAPTTPAAPVSGPLRGKVTAITTGGDGRPDVFIDIGSDDGVALTWTGVLLDSAHSVLKVIRVEARYTVASAAIGVHPARDEEAELSARP